MKCILRITALNFFLLLSSSLLGQRVTFGNLGTGHRLELDFRLNQNDYMGGFYLPGIFHPVTFYGLNYRHTLQNQITYIGTNLGYMNSTENSVSLNTSKKIGGSIYYGIQAISGKNRFMTFIECHIGYMPDDLMSSSVKGLILFDNAINNIGAGPTIEFSNYTFATVKCGFRLGFGVRN
jgi:hypothetical protein